jgi:hypothetical protein
MKLALPLACLLLASLPGGMILAQGTHDGFLSPQEFAAWPRALKTKDATHDPTTVPGGSAGSQHMPAN